MKKADISVGKCYRAKVSGRIVTVRVDGIEDRPYYFGRAHTAYQVTNLSTGRKLTFRSAAKFRGEVAEKPAQHIPDGTPGPKSLSNLFRF